jgi:cell division protein FtsN
MKIKFFAVILMFFASSCNIYKEFRSDYKQPQVRIVDMQGNPRDVQLRTPQDNAEALRKQGNLTYEKLQSQPPMEGNEVRISQNQYTNGNALQSTLAMPIDESQSENLKSAKIDVLEDKTTIKEVEYDLGKEEIAEPIDDGDKKIVQKAKKGKKMTVTKVSTFAVVKKGYYVQAGSFTDIGSAESHLDKISRIVSKSGNLLIQDAVVNNKNYHRVLIGPYKTRKSANLMISKLKRNGQKSILIKSR